MEELSAEVRQLLAEVHCPGRALDILNAYLDHGKDQVVIRDEAYYARVFAGCTVLSADHPPTVKQKDN